MHFTRIEPVVGDALRRMRVAIFGLPLAAPLVYSLAACGVAQWLWDGASSDHEVLAEELLRVHGVALGLRWQPFNDEPCDMVIGVGNAAAHQAWSLAQRRDIPALLIEPPSTTMPCATRVVLSDDDTVTSSQFLAHLDAHALLHKQAWHTSAFYCADVARAILLRQTEFARPDYAQRWQQHQRELYFDAPDQPLHVWQTPPVVESAFLTPPLRNGRCLIVGTGRLGSIAAREIAPSIHHAILIDSERVQQTHTAEQGFHQRDVGALKVAALAEHLARLGVQNTIAIAKNMRDEAQITALLHEFMPDVAIITTESNADFAFARALRAANIPHIVGRSTAQASLWQAMLVDGSDGVGFADMYARRNNERDLSSRENKPATLIEAGWAGAWIARLARQLLAPPGLRERWMLELLADQRTCLIGGMQNVALFKHPIDDVRQLGQISALAVNAP